MGKQTFEQERILHNAMVQVVGVKEELNGVKRIIAKLKSSEYPMIQKRNAGGAIFDSTQTNRKVVPGVGNTDTVPAMLTPGEFVVNKQATMQNLPLLHAINSGQVKGYELGGIVQIGDSFLVEGPDGKTEGPFNNRKDAEKASRQLKSGRVAGRPRIGGGLAGVGMSIGLGTLGFFGGSAIGEAVGGENGAMVGGLLGSIATMLLPNRIGKVPTGGLLPAVGQGAKTAGAAGPKIMLNTTPGFVSKAAGARGGATAAMTAARFAPLLLNPYVAVAALVVSSIAAVAITFKKLGDSNMQQYEVGRKMAQAMTTSADEISSLGTSAKDRAKQMENYLAQSERQAINDEYAEKISKAKEI